jgi:LysM repeat protein
MKYIVQPGESLYLLAGRFQTSVEELLAANNLSHPVLIFPGQLLSIPQPARLMPAALSAQPAAEGAEYFVQQDESLYDIAVKHNVPLRELIQINNITAPYIVYHGQSLVLPSTTES